MISVSVDVSDAMWDLLKSLPEWAVFHPDLEAVVNELAGQPITPFTGALICATLRERDERASA